MDAYEVVGDSTSRGEWLAVRREGIGASDAPAVLGVSPFANPLSVYADKLGLSEDTEATEAQRWGLLLEPLIATEFGEETGRTVDHRSELLRSRDLPWAQATLDGQQIDDERPDVGGLEIKATGFRAGDWTDGVPEHVFVQVQHQLLVTGYQWASVAVLLHGCQLRHADVERDERFISEVLVPELAEFWDRVQKGEPPSPDGSAAAARALRALYPDDDGTVVELPGHLIELDRHRITAMDQRREAQKTLDAIDQTIKAELGSHAVGRLANGVEYTYRTQQRDAYSVEAASFRVLRRRAPKG